MRFIVVQSNIISNGYSSGKIEAVIENLVRVVDADTEVDAINLFLENTKKFKYQDRLRVDCFPYNELIKL